MITQIEFFQELREPIPIRNRIHHGIQSVFAGWDYIMKWTFKEGGSIPRIGDKIHCMDDVLRTVNEVIWTDVDQIRVELSAGGPVAND